MGLNAEQLQAVNSNSDRILCLAGAGAGKTATMLERISRLVKDGEKPSSILALTFTNAAAAEMKERYEKQNLGAETPEFRTFHAFCYSLLCKDPAIRSALGYEDVPGIASEEQEKAIEEKAKTQCKITLTKNQLLNRAGLSKKEKYQVDLYDRAIRRIMNAENLITFDRLNSEVARLFDGGDAATVFYKDKYKYILADEIQDGDPHQMRFLNSFTKSNFYFTGDSLQNIYSFRGTSNEYIKALANAPGWEKIKLFTNYRSTNQICEYANKFSAKYADASYRIEMKGIRDGEDVSTVYVEGPSRYEPMDLKDIDDVLDKLNDISGTSAIICRTNKEVSHVCTYLKQQGIEFTTSKDTKIQKLIDCAISDTYALGVFASYLSSNKYGEYIRSASQVANPDLNWFLKLYGDNARIKDDMKSIKRLKDISTNLFPIDDKLDEVTKEFHIKNIKRTETDHFGVDFLKYLKEAIDDIKSSELYAGTIHSVKGLEYDNVFVMNVGSYNFRLDNEEMKNLFYVAITRAKNRLFIYKLLQF